jgi:hypothetical protein
MENGVKNLKGARLFCKTSLITEMEMLAKARNFLTTTEKEILIRVLRKHLFDNLHLSLKEREVREKRTQPPLL